MKGGDPLPAALFSNMITKGHIKIDILKTNTHMFTPQNHTLSIRMTDQRSGAFTMVSGITDREKAIAYLSQEMRVRLGKRYDAEKYHKSNDANGKQ